MVAVDFEQKRITTLHTHEILQLFSNLTEVVTFQICEIPILIRLQQDTQYKNIDNTICLYSSVDTIVWRTKLLEK